MQQCTDRAETTTKRKRQGSLHPPLPMCSTRENTERLFGAMRRRYSLPSRVNNEESNNTARRMSACDALLSGCDAGMAMSHGICAPAKGQVNSPA
jgi:hypothetical protein